MASTMAYLIGLAKPCFDQVQYARITSKTSRANAAIKVQAAYNNALALVASQLHECSTYAYKNCIMQILLAILLTVNLSLLLGTIMSVTPALSQERDRYVTPVVQNFVRALVEAIA